MKSKTLSTIFTAVALLTQLPVAAHPPALSLTPNTPASFSAFGLAQNIGPTVNSTDNESAAAVAPNGLSLYFSSSRPGTMGSLDLWVSQRATLTSAWGSPQNLTTLNSESNENLPTLSADGKIMFFNCSCPGSTGGADLYMTTRTDLNNDLSWTVPVNVGTVVNTSDNEIAPSYFQDQTNGTAVLYFTSDRAGSEDLYQSTRNANGSFNTPTNLTSLNSPLNDRGAVVRRDGLEIFLATDREGGLGGRDVWVSTRASLSAEWNPPFNLAGINSGGNDQSPYLSGDGSTLYLASSRDGGSGGNDIYSVPRFSINRSSAADFDGDGRADISVFRPSTGVWWVMNSGNGTVSGRGFGSEGDRIVPGDYDGDSQTDMAIFRPSTGVWWISRSTDNSIFTYQWGIATDKAVPDDYDGDGRTDIAVYRNGTWYIVRSSTGSYSIQQFGLPSDIPIAGNAQN